MTLCLSSSFRPLELKLGRACEDSVERWLPWRFAPHVKHPWVNWQSEKCLPAWRAKQVRDSLAVLH